MNFFRNLYAALILIMIGCVYKSDPEQLVTYDSALVNPGVKWILRSPAPNRGCEFWLSFAKDSKMILGYKGFEFEGYYEIDSTQTHYITINMFNKLGWDNQCLVNAQYLSLYDDDTEFFYQILDNRLYFEKNEKVIIFEGIQEKKSTAILN